MHRDLAGLRYVFQRQDSHSTAECEKGQLAPAVHVPALKNRQGTWAKLATCQPLHLPTCDCGTITVQGLLTLPIRIFLLLLIRPALSHSSSTTARSPIALLKPPNSPLWPAPP